MSSNDDLHIAGDDEGAGAQGAGGLNAVKTRIEGDEDPIAELQRKLEAEQQARRNAEAERDRAALEMRRQNEQFNLAQVEDGIRQIDNAMDEHQNTYIDAQERGDFAASAKAQRAMADLAATKKQLEQGRDHLRQQAEQATRAAPQEQQHNVEAIRKSLTDRSRSFIDENADYIKTPQATHLLQLAHQAAVAKGISVESDEYFDYIKDRMDADLGDRRMERRGDYDNQPAPQAKPRAPVSAPVNRSSGSARADSPYRSIRLTRDQADMADNLGITHEEYAKQLSIYRKSNQG